MGRPSKFDEKKAEQICLLLSEGNFLNYAAAFVGVHEDTVRNWLRQGRAEGKGKLAEFAARFEKAEATFYVDGHRRIRRGDKNSKDLQWLFSKKDPERYGDRVALHVREGLTEILDLLKAGLEPEVFERVIEILGAEPGAGSAQADPGSPPPH